MEKKNILLEKAYTYDPSNRQVCLSGCHFDELKGYWVFDATNEACILDSEFAKPSTKKCDIETGEDQKGE